MRSKLLAALALALLWAGCSEPKLDPANLDASIAALRESVDEIDRARFDAAIALVRQASAGEVPGTEPFPVAGMDAAAVLAEADRIGLRRERAFELESAAAHREILDAESELARLRVVEFVAQPIGATEMRADVAVANGLDFPVSTAWLRVVVAIPDGPSRSGEEFVSFSPPLAPGAERTVNILVSGDEARSLPVEPPAELECRFVLVDRGDQVALQAPSPEARERAEAALAESERRLAELDAKLATLAPTR